MSVERRTADTAAYDDIDSLDATHRKRSSVAVAFSVTVRPVNDQPFQLRTLSPSIDVVQSSRRPIGRDVLLAVDADTPPDELVYVVTVPPTNGHLLLTDIDDAVDRFTQHDVDDGRLAFQNDGTLLAGEFRFSVSDCRHRPVSKAFEIRVVQVYLRRLEQDGVRMPQGDTSCSLAGRHFGVESNNPDRSSIVFSVTGKPEYGQA